ncbi:MAG: hypothetical protein J0M07_14370 [Anaerolineae bacterium]|nr:hypothetical protein [Anaerolineae bacterium]
MKPRIVISTILLLGLLVNGMVSGQEFTVPTPERVFAPGIEVISVEVMPPYVPTYNTPTPSPTPAARCGLVPYQQLGETDDWFIDYAEAQIYASNAEIVPLTLCNRHTGERRELQVGEVVEGISPSPSGRYAVWIGVSHFFGYDFEQDELVVLGESQHNEEQSVSWYGNATVLIYQTGMPDSWVWVQVSLAYVDQANSLTHLGSILKFGEVPWFTHYQNPQRAAWVQHTEDGCSLNWIIEATGEQESFDINDLCVVGLPLSDDPYGDYLFMPVRYREVEEEPESRLEAFSRDLIRLNLTTGDREVWYSGEVERLNDYEPSQRYAALILDNNGCIDLINEDDPDYYRQCVRSFDIVYEAPEFEVALLDTQTHQLIYRHTVGFGDPRASQLRRHFWRHDGRVFESQYMIGEVDGLPGGDLFSLSDGLFVLFQEQVVDPSYRGRVGARNDIIVSVIGDNNVVETPLPGQLLLAGQDNAYLVLFNADRDVPDTPYLSEGDLLLSDLEGNSTLLLSDVVLDDQL